MDPSWCPGCDRLILPKRYIVPVNPHPAPPPPSAETLVASDPEDDPNHPPPPPAPTPAPSSPEVRKKPLPDAHRTKTTRAAAARGHGLGGGLVHGTGRIRPGGGLKPRTTPTESKKHVISPPKPAPQAATQVTDVLSGNPTAAHLAAVEPEFTLVPPPASTAAGKKTRVVISQEPTPLYCSDECKARDLKNSFIDSEAGGFGGAPVAKHRAEQMELVQQTVERTMKNRRASASSDKSAPHPRTPTDTFHLPILSPAQRLAEEANLPPAPPNTFVDDSTNLCRTSSMSSESSTSTASSSRLPVITSKDSTIRASSLNSKPRSQLPLTRSGSFSTWGSPAKAALAPPTQTLFTAGSSSSLSSSVSSVSAESALFEDDAVRIERRLDGEETCATTPPSRRGSGSSGASKKKRVSFASDSKPLSPAQEIAEPEEAAQLAPVREEWRMRRRRNPLLDANPLRDAVSVSPKDRVKASSLPADLLPPSLFGTTAPHPSLSSPSLAQRTPQVVDTPSPNRTPRANAYGIAMWPEDEKRTTESARVHGELLRGYAMRFGPREGRSLVWGRLYEGRNDEVSAPAPMSPPKHDSQRDYWRAFEEREAEARARRKAEAAVQRLEEEKVICELLGGVGMNEEDQPQARRMKQMAYDGTPGPAELRGLTYKFDRFLYPLMQPKPTIVEKTVRRWDEARCEWVEEITREEVYEERKKLFNFVED